ncbi:M17 family metallopeptidase [Staphylococcus auricularis]|uniref:M17 family metallopeptidase n=1 Tax=Staphylococcus auricularis TaxID=29379 RepID=UPI00242B16CC|nr:leucyl aminopeptidase family protein [Staphylococcus auricularis]
MTTQFTYHNKRMSNTVILGLSEELEALSQLELEQQNLVKDLTELEDLNMVTRDVGRINSTLYHLNGQPIRLVTVGLGTLKEATETTLSRAFGYLFQFLKQEKITHADLLFETLDLTESTDQIAEVMGIQSERAIYQFDSFKTSEKTAYELNLNVIDSDEAFSNSVNQGQIIGQSINLARNFSQLPPNILTPAYYAKLIEQHFAQSTVEVDIKNGESLEREGFGLIHAVGKGSMHDPALVTLTYHGGPQDASPIALVGKGITYDSGGYSIKSKTGMQEMKFDMCGSANVVAMIEAARQLELPVNLVGVLAIAENMISDAAMKPDDVFYAHSGESVEVLNSDAEGRLVLGDAVHYASQLNPKVIMDFATLTGAAIVALGEDKAAVFKNNDETPLSDILTLAEQYGEALFELPVTQTEQQRIRQSDVGDLVNHTNKQGKALFAAAFIGHFAGETPHLHFDVAGPATTPVASYNGPKGPTGVLVRTIVAWLRSL